MMKAKMAKLALFLLCMVALQQGIAFGNDHFTALEKQSAIISGKDIDPSALFYTESRLALAAEKSVRQRIRDPGAGND